jgi:phage shock protein C
MPDPAQPIRRSVSQKMIAGVCGGLAEWLGWDVTLVRVLAVLVSVFTGVLPGIVAYLALWLVIPEALVVGVPAAPPRPREDASPHTAGQ